MLFGGANGQSAGRVWLHDFKTLGWIRLPKLSGSRHGMGVTAFRGADGRMKLIAASGMHAASRFTDTTIFDVESQTATSATNYPDVVWAEML